MATTKGAKTKFRNRVIIYFVTFILSVVYLIVGNRIATDGQEIFPSDYEGSVRARVEVLNDVREANYALRIPLSLVGLRPRRGGTLRGDIGVLRGQNGATVARVYWSNKATAIVSDVPSEAALAPQNWGVVEMK